MTWVTNFLTSSIGKKLLMSLTGIFLITFLPVHLAGNLQLLYDDGGEAFNVYADFMAHNPFIQFTAKGLYFFIVLHSILGIVLWAQNKKAAKGKGTSRYAVPNLRATSKTSARAASGMAAIGTIILIFIVIHMYQFWFRSKFGDLPDVMYGDVVIADLYTPVYAAFTDWKFVLFYVVAMVFIAIHLRHGFQSAFQTLGLNHKKYTPVIEFVGLAYSILIPLGFAIIPIYFYVAYS